MNRFLLFCVACMLFAATYGPASAGWTVINLHPTGASESEAYGVSGGQQVGRAGVGGQHHAGLWSGTAASWVDLNALGSSNSVAYGVSDGQQVGFLYLDNSTHAGLWSGTAASWVDLNPAGVSGSVAEGVSGGQQVGYAWVGDQYHASLWSGTAESWVDLHALLPAEYVRSFAWGVFTSGVDTWVAGYAHNTSLGRQEALLWHYVPEPSTIPALLCGLCGLAWRRRK